MVKNTTQELNVLEFPLDQPEYNYLGDLINLEKRIQKLQKKV
jgi:hypothetical protein